MLYRIDPCNETVELIRDQKYPLDGQLKFDIKTRRYRIAATGRGEGYFFLGGYESLLRGVCYIRVPDSVPPAQFRARVQFLHTADAAENVLSFSA